MTFRQSIAILRARFWPALLAPIAMAGTMVGVSLELAKKHTAASVLGFEPASERYSRDASIAEVARWASP